MTMQYFKYTRGPDLRILYNARLPFLRNRCVESASHGGFHSGRAVVVSADGLAEMPYSAVCSYEAERTFITWRNPTIVVRINSERCLVDLTEVAFLILHRSCHVHSSR